MRDDWGGPTHRSLPPPPLRVAPRAPRGLLRIQRLDRAARRPAEDPAHPVTARSRPTGPPAGSGSADREPDRPARPFAIPCRRGGPHEGVRLGRPPLDLGRCAAFSVRGRKRAADPLSIWEMEIASASVRRVASCEGSCTRAIYGSRLYRLDAGEPSPEIVFTAKSAEERSGSGHPPPACSRSARTGRGPGRSPSTRSERATRSC